MANKSWKVLTAAQNDNQGLDLLDVVGARVVQLDGSPAVRMRKDYYSEEVCQCLGNAGLGSLPILLLPDGDDAR